MKIVNIFAFAFSLIGGWSYSYDYFKDRENTINEYIHRKADVDKSAESIKREIGDVGARDYHKKLGSSVDAEDQFGKKARSSFGHDYLDREKTLPQRDYSEGFVSSSKSYLKNIGAN